MPAACFGHTAVVEVLVGRGAEFTRPQGKSASHELQAKDGRTAHLD